MKAVVLRGAFGIENMVLTDLPDPIPGPGQALVRIKAASLNYRDWLMVMGRYNPKQPLPFIPLSDGAGEVVALGPGAQGLRIGDRVMPLFAQGWLAGPPTKDRLRQTLGGPFDGVLTELAVFPCESLVPIPTGLSNVQAATLPCAALTAWTALFGSRRVQPGETVLVQGTGGVSIFALQFAVLAGARVIVTSSSSAKLERATALGAWATINYRETPAWGRKAKALTDGQGVDYVVEVGGAATIQESLQALAPGGHMAVIGVLSGGVGTLSLLPVLMQAITLQGVLVGHRDGFTAMNRAIAAHELQPVIDRVWPWQQAGQALQSLETAQHFGKICLDFDA